jgi:hypothetical protein
MKNFILAALVVIGFMPASLKASESDPWEGLGLPQMKYIYFTKSYVGFASLPSFADVSRGKHFYGIFDKTKETMQFVGRSKFVEVFPEAINQPELALSKAWEFRNYPSPKSSSGDSISIFYRNSSEGDSVDFGITTFTVRSVNFSANLGSSLIGALEIFGDELWLGTEEAQSYNRSHGGQGILIYSLKTGKLIEKLNEKKGLSGDLIHLIRKDPFTEEVWIATQYGFDRLTLGHKLIRKYYFRWSGAPGSNPKYLYIGSKKYTN